MARPNATEVWKAHIQPGCDCVFCSGAWSVTDDGMCIPYKWALSGQKVAPGCHGRTPTRLSGLDAWLPQPGPGVTPVYAPLKTVAKTGYNCKRCNFKNDYACSNQPDGTYVCFNCR